MALHIARVTLAMGLALALPSAVSAGTPMVLHEELKAIPKGYTMQGAANPSTAMTLQVALPLQNTDELTQRIYAGATPGTCYGQFMTMEEVNDLVAPLASDNSAVLNWLRQSGVSEVYSDGTYVTFATTVGQANKLLNTTFSWFSGYGQQKLRTTQYSLPADVAPSVDIITPTTFIGTTRPQQPVMPLASRVEQSAPSKRQVQASCQTSITPDCTRELYNIGGYVGDESSGSRIAFGSFLNQSALHVDLDDYEKYFDLPPRNFTVQTINGGVDYQDPNYANVGEADLDVQNIVGITTGSLPIMEYITGGLPPVIPNLDEPVPADYSNEPYVPYYKYLLSQPNENIPQVITNSYGDDEQTVPLRYAYRTCYMIGMLVSRGFTVLESSGDTGVGGPCLSNDGSNQRQFTPQFPGTCPFITDVGGTQAVTPEVAWNASTGGFSNYFSRAPYQEAAVTTYLNNYISPAVKQYYQPFTNFSGRGIPDVAAHSLYPDFEVFYNGKPSPSGGTSAASPLWAGVVGLLNDARLKAHLPPLGFLNPWLYSEGFRELTDITGGGSKGCLGYDLQTGMPYVGGGIIPYASWNATPGWDPVTGLGTPNFQKLKAAVLALGKGTGSCW